MPEEGSDQFSGRLGLIFATIGAAIGTGNIWRFPRMVGANGGGSFLVPWLIFLFLWSVPLIIAEFALGTPPRSTKNGIPLPRVMVTHIAGQDFLCLEFTRAEGQRAAVFSSQQSQDLTTWSNNATMHGGETVNPDGSITSVFRYPEPINSTGGRSGFLRLYISD